MNIKKSLQHTPRRSPCLLWITAVIIALTPFAQADKTAAPLVIATFGDSLSAGYGLPEAQGFAPVLQRALQSEGRSVRVVNAAISGETSANARQRVNWMLEKYRPDMVIIEFGANDMLRGLPTESVYENLSVVIEAIQTAGAKILLAGMLATPNNGLFYQNDFAEVYERLEDDHDIALYPFFLEGVATVPSLNLDDGIHPNAAGVRTIVKNITPHVLDVLDD